MDADKTLGLLHCFVIGFRVYLFNPDKRTVRAGAK